MDAEPVITDDTKELVRDREDTEDVDSGRVEEHASSCVAKVDPTAEVRVGETIPLVVDTSEIHLFDRPTGVRSRRTSSGRRPPRSLEPLIARFDVPRR